MLIPCRIEEYGNVDDPIRHEQGCKCEEYCNRWFHQSCAEEYGPESFVMIT